jgi:hypothetical protein
VTVRNDLEYSFGRTSLSWTPLAIRFSEALYDSPGTFLFYYPVIVTDPNPLTERLLLSNAGWIRAKVTPASTFRTVAEESMEVLFTLENGRAIVADYYPWPAQSWGRAGDRVGIYAHAVFSQGILTRRSVDVDGDGIFEREETYVFDPPKASRILGSLDAAALYRELFGSMPFAPGLYCSKVTLDLDGDTVADFTEEYLENNGKISRWTASGESAASPGWSVSHIRYGTHDGVDLEGGVDPGSVQTEVHFRYGGGTVIIHLHDGLPVSLTRDGRRTAVTSVGTDTYWIGDDTPGPRERAAIRAALAALPPNTVTIGDYDTNGTRLRAYLARIGDYKFGEFVDE